MNGYRTSWWLIATIVAGLGGVACGSQGGSSPLGNSGNGSGGSGNGFGSGTASGSGSGAAASGGVQGNSGTDNSGTSGTGVAGPSGSSGAGTGTGSGVASGSGAINSGAGGSPSGAGGGSGSSDDFDAGIPPIMTVPHMGNTCLKPVTDFTHKGPYTVTKSSVDLAGLHELPDAGPTTYSIFTPGPLDPNCKAPVVIWGNGTGVTGSSMTAPAGACTGMSTLDCLSGTYDFFNVYAASFGIVVMASDNSNVGLGIYHKAAADYMTKENADPMSPFYQKLSGRFGVSGHSQGGIGATTATSMIGPACQAEVCVAGGGLPQKTTAFLCLTGTKDLAESACKSTFGTAAPPAFLADWDGGDHVTTETLAGYVGGQTGTHQMMYLMAAWFRCYLADDQVACKMFEGGTPNNCGLCKNNPGWAILDSKGL